MKKDDLISDDFLKQFKARGALRFFEAHPETWDRKDDKPYREPQREDKKVHQEQTFFSNGRCGNEIRIFGPAEATKKWTMPIKGTWHHFKSVPNNL